MAGKLNPHKTFKTMNALIIREIQKFLFTPQDRKESAKVSIKS